MCLCYGNNHLLLNCCYSLFDIRNEIAGISGYKVQRFLHDTQSGIAFRNGLQFYK